MFTTLSTHLLQANKMNVLLKLGQLKVFDQGLFTTNIRWRMKEEEHEGIMYLG